MPFTTETETTTIIPGTLTLAAAIALCMPDHEEATAILFCHLFNPVPPAPTAENINRAHATACKNAADSRADNENDKAVKWTRMADFLAYELCRRYPELVNQITDPSTRCFASIEAKVHPGPEDTVGILYDLLYKGCPPLYIPKRLLQQHEELRAQIETSRKELSLSVSVDHIDKYEKKILQFQHLKEKLAEYPLTANALGANPNN